MFRDLDKERQQKIESLKSIYGAKKIDALLEAGFRDDAVIDYLEGKKLYNNVMKAVKAFLRTKALLEFHDIQNADQIAAILAAPMNAPEFPSSIGIHDAVYVTGDVDTRITGTVDANVTGRVDTSY